MAFGRTGGAMLSTPRLVTMLVSLVLIGLVLASFMTHMPSSLALVKTHRVSIAVAAYAVLLSGVVLRRL